MASTSTSTQVVLPSIHEMFPEHLIPRSTNSRPHTAHTGFISRNQYVSSPPAPPHHSFSFDVLKSDPRGASLTTRTCPRPPQPRVRTQPMPVLHSHMQQHRPHSSSGSSDGDAELDGVEMDAVIGEDPDGDDVREGKNHVCPTCSKRFNRPSSLRIHVNTHTGATPFRCPHPGCGRAFNVNSNMRRHFRNHASPAFVPSPTSTSSLPPLSSTPSSSFNSTPWSALSSPLTPVSASPSSKSSAYSQPVAHPHAPAFSADKFSTVSSCHPRVTQKNAHTADVYAKPGLSLAAARYSESDVRSERR